MKYKRILSLLVVSSLFFYTTGVNALFTEKNRIIASKTAHTVSPGLEYTSSIEIIDGLRREIYSFSYTPDSGTVIIPAYGEYLYSFNSVGQLISSYDGEGRVVGGINTDFFITSTGIPLSCLIYDGEIISSCDNRPAIGFNEKGSAVIGYPNVEAKFISDNKELNVAHINKTPAVWGMYLLTDEFSKTTRSTLDSIEIVFRPFEKSTEDIPDAPEKSEYTNKNTLEQEESIDSIENYNSADTENTLSETSDSEPAEKDATTEEIVSEEDAEVPFDFGSYIFTDENIIAGQDINVVVTEIRKNSVNSEIPKDSFVLCIPTKEFGYVVEDVKVGDEFRLSSKIDKTFTECVNIFGVGSIILDNGEYVEQTADSIYKYRNPRTAAGILEDGTVIFVAVDGRRKGVSEGFTAKELSDYMKSLGCISAVNFDGGGSTTFYAADIGEVYTNLKNTPSEGSERRVSDGLIFVNTTEEQGNIAYGAMYPGEYLVFNSDTTIDFSGDVLFADSNFHPVAVSDENVTISVDKEYGDTYDNVFVPSGKTGNASVTATVTENEETKLLNVGNIGITDKVNGIDITASHTTMTPFDKSAKLDVSAYLDTIPVEISPKNIEWNIFIEKITDSGSSIVVDASSDYADVDYATMEFVPHIKGNKYIISASIGDFSEKIEIFSEKMPYIDMELHWAAQTTYDMYKSGFITGELHADGNTYFMPDRFMTRAEFCVLLSRILSLEPESDEEITPAEKSVDEKESTTDEEVAENTLLEETNTFDEAIIKNDIITEGTSEETTQENAPEYDFSDVPQWAKGYIAALYREGYLSELLVSDASGNLTLNSDEYITRADVIRTLGALLENIKLSVRELVGLSEKYSDFVAEKDNDILYFSRIIKYGIINGYEDGTLRQNSNISRAEAATVFSRFLNVASE